MPKDELKTRLTVVPDSPGVYLMRDETGRVIYVGKAFNLKKRLSSYFVKRERLDPKTGVLVSRMASFDTVVTATENEALILEANLIRRYKPRYNVILKDDKRYLSLRLDPGQPYPALELVRKRKEDGALYFGPFPSSRSVRETLKVVDRTFRLRKCRGKKFKTRSRPCINYQMGLCLAPCCRDVDAEEYNDIVKEVALFLRGRTSELIDKIKAEMQRASDAMEFEKAARLRDKMFAVERVTEKQVVVASNFADRDVIGMAEDEELTVLSVLNVRRGALVGTRFFSFAGVLSPPGETIRAFITQYYGDNRQLPDEILSCIEPSDVKLVRDHLREVAGRLVGISVPKRGKKALLVRMALENAKKELKARLSRARDELLTLERLQKKLALGNLPVRIECFDNSHLSGTGPVAAMSVFINGVPDKSGYRRYRILKAAPGDDYGSMFEVLSRRFSGPHRPDELPDLLLVDGGRGQLNIAVAVLKEVGLLGRFGVAAISKGEKSRGDLSDKVYLPGRRNPVGLLPDDPALHLLQRLRDEAHRFAVSYQRKKRGLAAIESVLDGIPGIGRARKRMLIERFGSVGALREATEDEIASLPGITASIAATIKERLAGM